MSPAAVREILSCLCTASLFLTVKTLSRSRSRSPSSPSSSTFVVSAGRYDNVDEQEQELQIKLQAKRDNKKSYHVVGKAAKKRKMWLLGVDVVVVTTIRSFDYSLAPKLLMS